jgi:hypothetical protein
VCERARDFYVYFGVHCPLERARRGSESIIAQPNTYLSIKFTAFISAGVGGACPLILDAQVMKGSKC